MSLFTPELSLPCKSQWDLDFGAKHTFRHPIHPKLTKGSHANYEELLAEVVKVFSDSSPEEWTYLSKMHCTSKLSTSHTSMFSSWKNKDEKQKSTIQRPFPNRVHVPRVRSYLWNERDVYSCVWFYEFDKYLSSNVPQELCNNRHVVTWSAG